MSKIFPIFRKHFSTPPYRFLPWAVFFYVLIAFGLHPHSTISTYTLNGPDDFMRLNQVINWFMGQGWYDTSQPRLSPGAHTVIHWARLVDLPIAALMRPFAGHMDITDAAMIAAFIVPLGLLILALKLVPALAEPLVGKNQAKLAAPFLLFAPMVLFNFAPGRVDHHGWQILIAGFGLLCLQRMTRDAAGWRWGVFAAAGFACGLWIGAEALPWIIVFVACLVVTAAWRGDFILRNAAVFGVTFSAATMCVLPLALPMVEWGSCALSWFSPAYVIFSALVGGMFVLLWMLGRLTTRAYLRLALAAALASFSAFLFVYFVPHALNGVFADYDFFNATIALDNIGEATPLSVAFHINRYNPLTYTRAGMAFLHYLLLPFVAFVAVIFGWRRALRDERLPWIFQGVFLLSAILLTVFYQVRVGTFMEFFAIAPLVFCVLKLSDVVAIRGGRGTDRSRPYLRLFIFIILIPLPILIIPALVSGAHIYPGLILFPAARATNDACDLKGASAFLASPLHRYVYHPTVILSGGNEGAELLFRTPHAVLAGNFNVAGNRDVYDFFNARDEATALRILKKWHVNVVLTCRNSPPFYAGLDHPRIGKNAFFGMGADGKLHLTSDPAHPALIERLVNGKIPAWLKPVEMPEVKGYLLFDVANSGIKNDP
jgi:hypothetical protein